MAKAEEKHGFTWPMLATAWLTPLLLGATVFLLSTLDKKESLAGRMAVVEQSLGVADQAKNQLNEKFKVEAAWIGFVDARDRIDSLPNGLAIRPWTGSDKSSEIYNRYSALFARKQLIVESLGGFQKYMASEYGAALRTNLAYLATERRYDVPAMGASGKSAADMLERTSASDKRFAAEAADKYSKDFYAGKSAAEIKNDPSYSGRTGMTLKLVDILQMNVSLLNKLAGRSIAVEGNLVGKASAEPAINKAMGVVQGLTTPASILESSKAPIDDIKDTSAAEDQVRDQWANVYDALSSDRTDSITKTAREVQLKDTRENISRDIRAVTKSTLSYNALLSGQIDPGSRRLGSDTPLNDTMNVDAQITWYDSNTNMTRISVGSDKNAHPGMRFEIWNRDENGYYLRAGVLEITGVLGRNYSTAIVIHEVDGRPISASDDLVNRIWEDGKYVSVGLLGRNWGGEYTRYSRSELLTMLQNLGVPANNVPDMTTDVIVTGGDPHADNTDGINTHDINMWRNQLSKVQIREDVVRIYIDPR